MRTTDWGTFPQNFGLCMLFVGLPIIGIAIGELRGSAWDMLGWLIIGLPMTLLFLFVFTWGYSSGHDDGKRAAEISLMDRTRADIDDDR